MKITADEGVDRAIVDAVRAGGWVVEWIAESAPGADDELVLSLARGAATLLLTETRISPPSYFAGCTRPRESCFYVSMGFHVSTSVPSSWPPFPRVAPKCPARSPC